MVLHEGNLKKYLANFLTLYIVEDKHTLKHDKCEPTLCKRKINH